MKYEKSVFFRIENADFPIKLYYKLPGKSAQSNSPYVGALHNLVEHCDGVKKFHRFFFVFVFWLSRAAKIFFSTRTLA